MPAVGIDLGTTFSCVGIWKNTENTVVIIPNEQGDRVTPSYVSFNKDERLVGGAAKNQCARNPANTIFDAKRLIGRKFDDALVQKDRKVWPFTIVKCPDGRPQIEVKFGTETKRFFPEEISAMVVEKLKDVANEFLKQPVEQAVITVPAYFNDTQRQATKDAGKIAGLEVLRIINEPTAAALAYGLNKTEEQNILIFDLGGGTFDVSLLNMNDGVFEVLATGGDTHLGGQDFDNHLINFCVNDFQKKTGKDIKTQARSMRRLRTMCEAAKRVLSSAIFAPIEVDSLFDGEDYVYRMSRTKFEFLCQKDFDKCMESVKLVLADATMGKEDVDEVVIVGGSTRIPKIRQNLKDFFGGKHLCQDVNADEAVAFGAAVQAANLTNAMVQKDIVLLDVTPLTLGMETKGGVMCKIINRNSKIPTKQSKHFSTSVDNQTEVRIAVFEGEREFIKDNRLLGSFDLQNIAKAPRGKPAIDVTFELDVNSILKVTAQDMKKKKGGKRSLQIQSTKGTLDDADIQRAIADSKKFAKQDKVRRKRLEAYQNLEDSCMLYLTQHGERAEIKECCERIMEWLDMDGADASETTLNAKLTELLKHVHDLTSDV